MDANNSVAQFTYRSLADEAVAWELIALTFTYPTKHLADVVVSGEWNDAVAEISSALDLSLLKALSKDTPLTSNMLIASESGIESNEEAMDALLRELRIEYTRLFFGIPQPVVIAYEGIWAAKDDDMEALHFISPKAMEVERFCKACGLGRPEGVNEPLDFIVTECELLQYLAFLASKEETPASISLPGGSAKKAYEIFLREHAQKWMPSFAEAVIIESKLPFYSKGAVLLLEILKQSQPPLDW